MEEMLLKVKHIIKYRMHQFEKHETVYIYMKIIVFVEEQ